MIEQIFQILGYLHGMWRYRWSALAVTWLSAIAGLIVVMALPNTYEVKAVFHVDTQSILNTLLKGLAVEDQETNADVELVKRMMLSRENLLQVIRETDMDLLATTPQSLDLLVDKLAKDIQISGGSDGGWRRSNNNIYEITYSARQPDQVYKVVSSFMDSFIENTLNAGRVDTASAEAFLDKQIKDYEARLVEAEQRLADFKKKNVGAMPDERGGYYNRLQRSEVEAEETKTAIRLAERRLAELTKQLQGEKPVYSSAGVDIKARKAEYYRQLELLLTEYTEQHPDVIALKQKIENLSSEKGSVPLAGLNPESAQFETNPVYQELKIEESKARIDLETLRLTLNDQLNQISKLRAAIDSIPEVEAEYSRLNRDYEVTNERYLELVERRESAELAREAKQSASEVKFRIIEPPILPTKPTGPNRQLYSVAVFIGAIGLGMGWGLVRFLMHPTFIGVNQLKEAFTYPVLGSVGLNLTEDGRKRRLNKMLMLAGSLAFLALIFVIVILLGNQVTDVIHPLLYS